MNNKPASLADVDVRHVSLVDLVRFIEKMEEEFPAGVKILAKKLLTKYVPDMPEPDFMPYLNDSEITNSFRSLRSEIQEEAIGQNTATMVLTLHSAFGFGRKRIIRLWGQASEAIGSEEPPSVEQLVRWCEARGIDYDQFFGFRASAQ